MKETTRKQIEAMKAQTIGVERTQRKQQLTSSEAAGWSTQQPATGT